MRWRDLHKYLSYFVLLGCVYAVASGMGSQFARFKSGPEFLKIGVIVFFLLVWGIMEVGH